MIVHRLFVVCLFSLAKAQFNCATPQRFMEFNANLVPKNFNSLTTNNQPHLHSHLFDKGTELERGNSGDMKYAANFKEFVIKRVMKGDVRKIRHTRKLIDILKVLCGMNPMIVYDKLLECATEIIDGFRGCVEDDEGVSIFLNSLYRDLRTGEDVLKKYRSFFGKEKLDFIIKLIYKFQQIHNKGIVHNDIKPASIMATDKKLTDTRIVNFGVAGKLGEPNYSGTPLFVDPHRFDDASLTFEGDIYSLAITFAVLEEGGEKAIWSIPKKCFLQRPDDSCTEAINSVVTKAFSGHPEEV